jgi:hypothetical protein
MKNQLFRLAFAVVIIVGALHLLGTYYDFYWDSFWFDALMHFLGELAMGLLFLWLWYVSGLFEKSLPSKREAMVATVVFAMFVGFGWEVFEYAYGIAVPVGANYPVDTFHDLVFDFVGGVAAGLAGQVKSLYA